MDDDLIITNHAAEEAITAPNAHITPRPRHAVDAPFLSGWGCLGVTGREQRSERLEALTERAVLSRGLGRSYGDSALPPPGVNTVATTTLADRILAFDRTTGLMRVEAGVSLHTLNRLLLHQGWFTPVSPGTQYVTVGGMVASDIHGKNHHVAGCFGAHVQSLRMRVADGRIITCNRELEADLFRATLGGMGLTGHILEVTFKMRQVPSPWIYQETERIPDIDAFMAALDDAKEAWPATMGWIDCLKRGPGMGRGIIYRGRWASPDEAPAHPPRPKKRQTMPCDLPSWSLNRASIATFNGLLYRSHWRRKTQGIVHPEVFYYPLDKIQRWNRLYGKLGFTQYQAVFPRAAGPGAARRFLELLTTLGGASFLCVIKDCGPQGEGLLSFPMAGISIALDIPARAHTQALVDRLNAHVIDEGGRIYLSKDTFTRAADFRAMEPRLDAFLEVRRAWDPDLRIRSAQSVRLFGDPCDQTTR
jgi:decaprenylphospho-beta-D-ribofuranose 2-oxidase